MKYKSLALSSLMIATFMTHTTEKTNPQSCSILAIGCFGSLVITSLTACAKAADYNTSAQSNHAQSNHYRQTRERLNSEYKKAVETTIENWKDVTQDVKENTKQALKEATAADSTRLKQQEESFKKKADNHSNSHLSMRKFATTSAVLTSAFYWAAIAQKPS